jgi:hypothetical protein
LRERRVGLGHFLSEGSGQPADVGQLVGNGQVVVQHGDLGDQCRDPDGCDGAGMDLVVYAAAVGVVLGQASGC